MLVKKFISIFTCIISCLFISAKESKHYLQGKDVIITANLKNTGFDHVPLDILIPDFFAKKSLTYKSVQYDSATGYFKGKFYIKQPQLMLFFLKEVFVTPGDSIELKYVILKNTPEMYKDTLIISGTNAANYQYYKFFRNEYTFNNPYFPKYTHPLSEKRFTEYKRRLDIYYKKLYLRFVKSLESLNYSDSYKKYVEKNLYYYWICKRLTPLYEGEKVVITKNEMSEIKSHLLERIDTTAHTFYAALIMLHKVTTKIVNPNYSIAEFRGLKNDAVTYPNYLRDFLLTNDIIEFIDSKRDSSRVLAAELSRGATIITTKKYVEKLQPYTVNLNTNSTEIPAEIFKIKLRDPYNQIVSFGDIILKNSNNLIYVDFWASWCIPCRNETVPLKKLHDKVDTSAIKFIQISVDEDTSKWKEAMKEDDVKFSEKYCFVNKDDYLKFSLTKEFTPIPYYLIIDKKGRLIVKRAPRPSDPMLKLLIDKNL